MERLGRLDTCAVSDAMDKLGLEGVVTGLAQVSIPRRIAGRAVTMKLGVGAPPPGPVRHLGTHGDRVGVEVRPGDYVLADDSAVIFIRPDDLAAVLEAAEAIAAREAAMITALETGRPISEVMGANYEHMLRRE